MKIKPLLPVAILATAIAALIAAFAADGSLMQHMNPGAAQSGIQGDLPALGGATGWLNSPPLAAPSLRGKVVVVDFWTYSCINWLRTLPYVQAWAAKYKDQGLVVIGVHSPEFDFEKNVDNVRQAAKEMGINYPIAIDSNLAIWRAFKNDYWPALYFIDAKGHVRHHQFGEGEYEESERVIQQLLAEAGTGSVGHELVLVDARGVEAAADLGSLRSPETYVGYARAENFVSRDGTITDKHHVYVGPARLWLNHWALSGDWTVGRQAITQNAPGDRIVYRFHARDLNWLIPTVQAATSHETLGRPRA